MGHGAWRCSTCEVGTPGINWFVEYPFVSVQSSPPQPGGGVAWSTPPHPPSSSLWTSGHLKRLMIVSSSVPFTGLRERCPFGRRPSVTKNRWFQSFPSGHSGTLLQSFPRIHSPSFTPSTRTSMVTDSLLTAGRSCMGLSSSIVCPLASSSSSTLILCPVPLSLSWKLGWDFSVCPEWLSAQSESFLIGTVGIQMTC